MAYKIVITEIERDVPYTSKEWRKLRDDEDKDPSGKNELYDYVETDALKNVEREVLRQEVDELDLRAVVAVINNITIKES